jgi:hypothetical protein
LTDCRHPVYVVDVLTITVSGQVRKEDNNTGLDHINSMERRRISTAPTPNGGNGRDANGRWAKGNGGGPGNPLSRKVQAIRVALVSAITAADIKAVVQRLVQKAKDGDVAAAKVVFDRACGPAQALDFDLRLTEIESRLLESERQRGSK